MSPEPRPVDDPEKKKPSEPDDWVQPPRAPRMRFGLRTLMLIVLGVGLLLGIGTVGGAIAFTGSLVVLFACAIGAATIVARRRSTQQDGLLWVLAIAAGRAMPLEPALEAFSEQCSIGYRHMVRTLAHLVARGSPLPDALAEVPGVLPGEAEVLVRAGWESGSLAGALHEAAETVALDRPRWAVLSGRLSYLFGVIAVMQVLTGFVMYFIVPKFEAIFKDFGVELPSFTVATIQASHVIMRYSLISIPLFLIEVMLLLAWPGMTFLRPYFERGVRLSFLVWFLLFVFFTLPTLAVLLCYGVWTVSDRFVFGRRHTAVLLRALAWFVEGGKPLSTGLEMLARSYPRHWVRQRLERVAADVSLGQDWIDALGRSRLIKPADAALLDSARRVGNLPWALREAAEGGERRLSYRLQWIINMVFPLFVLSLGALVGAFALAYFAPLVTLIERLVG